MSIVLNCRRVILLLMSGVVVMLLFSCHSGEINEEEEQGHVLNIGHAGMGFKSLINPFNAYPDNSMASIRKAMSLGAHGVEVDVQLSKDSILILYHDKFLESKTDKKGCINDLLANDVIGTPYEIGFPFDWWHDEKIITLDSLISEFAQRDTFPWIYLDIHSHNYCDTEDAYYKIPIFARSLARLVEKRNVPQHKIKPTSSYVPMLKEIRTANEGMKLLFEEHEDFNRGVKIVEDNHFDGLVIKRAVIPSSQQVKLIKEKGIEVVFFGGKAKSTIREMLEPRPNVLQVNNVKALKEILDEELTN